jgi:hypothetical protein
MENRSVHNHRRYGHIKVSNSGKERKTLINVEPLREVVECALISPYVKNENPLSLLIVAKAESGKTSVMKLYRQNKGVAYLSDCTAYGLTRDILPKMVSGEVRTLVIPDLITPLSKSTKTRQSFVAFLNNLIEEGVAKMTTYTTVWDKEVKANLITAVTDEALDDGRHEWAKMGFLSRFIVFSYAYSTPTIAQILKSCSEHGLSPGEADFRPPEKEVDVYLPRRIADKLDPFATKVGEQFSLYGIRAKINFRCLLKCLAYRNRRRMVTDSEFTEFLDLVDFMNFSFKQM